MNWLWAEANAGSPDDERKFTWKTSPKSFPYGLWFRGERDSATPMTPSVFRARHGTNHRLHENNISNHLQARITEVYDIRNPFDKLCVAQHYNIPTRLLDWSESILVAAFFAVWDDESANDAKIYVLNARSLNEVSGMGEGKGHVHTSNDFGTLFRAEAAFRNSRQDWVLSIKNRWPHFDWTKPSWPYSKDQMDHGDQFAKFLEPVAVMPARTRQRMIVQSSVFTAHGGNYCWAKADHPNPMPNDVEYTIYRDGKPEKIKKPRSVYKTVTIPRKAKKDLKAELFRYGIHEGTLFPEMEHQRAYLTEIW